MLFLPECLGFMGDSAEHTLTEADPPIDEISKRNNRFREVTPFRRSLANTIEMHAAATSYDANRKQSEYDEDPFTSIIEELQYIAFESQLWISGGGVHTKVSRTTATKLNDEEEQQQNKIYNTHIIIDNEGQIKAHYHKIHLFDVSIPNKVNLRESKTTCPGKQLVVCDSPIGKLGLSICYDMRFPEMYVDLVQKMGAQILLMPSAFTVPTGNAHWHTLLKGMCYIDLACF